MGWFDDIVNPTKTELDAIYQYVESQRVKIPKFSKLEASIISFEKWYQGLGVSDWLLDNETLNEAKRRRNAINEIIGDKPDPTWTPADGPYTPADPSGAAKGAKTLIDYLPTILLGAVAVGGVAVVGTAAYRATTFIPERRGDK